MSEDSRKHSKNEAKEQRKKRQGRQHATAKKDEKAPEKKVEATPKVAKEPEKPAYEPPGPEFYNNLKRETDEILKITEEANSKYKKKEIQSNWAKYEMPIETYEEIDEQENLGADYETLIQSSFSVGGHFQFKHEKSWDITSGPTPYDKYFEINMESLNTALSTIPFYERNLIEKLTFNESDIQSMDHRATKFKQKYYNDKKYTTPELEAQDKILNNLKNSDKEANSKYANQNDLKDIKIENIKPEITSSDNIKPQEGSEVKEVAEEPHIAEKLAEISLNNEKPSANNEKPSDNKEKSSDNKEKPFDNKDLLDDLDDLLQNDKNISETKQEIEQHKIVSMPQEIELPKAPKEYTVKPKVPAKNPVIESPEDLEKWLDDFLDG